MKNNGQTNANDNGGVADNSNQNQGNQGDQGNQNQGNQQQNNQNQGNQQQNQNQQQGAGQQNEKVFTQSQVDAIKANAEKEATNSFLSKMGIDESVADEQINRFKAFQDAQKSEEEKIAEQTAARLKKEAEQNERVLTAELKGEAMVLGANSKYIDDIVVLAMSKISKNQNADINTVLSELKTKHPIFFEKEDDNSGAGGQEGTGSSMKNFGNKNKGNENQSLGTKLAAQKRAQGNKKSYFG